MEKKLEEKELKEGDGTIKEMDYVPYGVKSFSDLQAYRAAQEISENLGELVSDVYGLSRNIVMDTTVIDKKSALADLMAEFISVLTTDRAMSDEEIAGAEMAEAATMKASALAAIKALEKLLSEKSLPKSLVSKVTEMKGALRRTWKDLKDEKELEGVASPEMDDTEKVKESLAEDFGGVLELVDLEESEGTLVEMGVQLIRPGWGNKRDGHYYPAEMLKQNAERFVGAKMYETDHKPGEKSTRTWVSTVKEIAGYADDGAPIAKVAVHDPNFAERCRNLKKAGLLEKMECSILADGTARAGEVEGRKGKIVESITDVSSVDWVTKAGAGGHALTLEENDKGGQMAEEVNKTTEAQSEPVAEVADAQPVRLNEAQVKSVLQESTLPNEAKEKLTEGEWADETTLKEAIQKEVAYIKKLTGSGRPFGLGDTKAPVQERMSEKDYDARIDGVFQKYGLGG